MATFTITWRGKSGAAYHFQCFPDGQAFNPVSAVYIFCREVSGAGWEALYVGEAGDIRQRLNSGATAHDGYRRAKLAGMTHIAALAVSGNAERLRVETDLRHGLNPKCNRQDVPSMRDIYALRQT